MQSKAILLSVFTTLSDESLNQMIEKLISRHLDIDRVLISNSTYINDIDQNNKYNCLLTCNVADMTLHELNFITASLNKEKT